VLDHCIQFARGRSKWDFGNKVLYDLCATHPRHTRDDVIIAKVWLIGRSYAAAIERGRPDAAPGDAFYEDVVAVKIMDSPIDDWLRAVRRAPTSGARHVATILSVHNNLTRLFSEISGKDRRSLASKYLHFHAPDYFYIYDTRAVKGLSAFTGLLGRQYATPGEYDPAYKSFVLRCVALRQFLQDHKKARLDPRRFDNFLLHVAGLDEDTRAGLDDELELLRESAG
jgi:hypothetical protein